MALRGTIKCVVAKSGFGFIRREDTEYFFHRSALAEGATFEQLRPGQEVHFEPDRRSLTPRAQRVVVP